MRKYKHIKSINQSTNQPTSPHLTLSKLSEGQHGPLENAPQTPLQKKKKKKKNNQLKNRLLGWNLNNN
jgi:hypothetical protein